MKNKKLFLILAMLVLGLILVSISCTRNSTTSNFHPLSEAEKEKVIQIALDTPEASAQLQKGLKYTASLDWVGIVWVGTHASEEWGFDYDAVEKGIPSNIPQSAIIYSRAQLSFGEPPEVLIRVAVDIPTEKAVFVESYPLKKLPQ